MESDQLLFECIQCGQCCNGYGGTYLEASDISRIADFVGVSETEFRQRYCTLSGNRPILSQQSDGYCIFFDRNCTIHPVKPRMCRQWPFIDSLLVDISNWHVMAGVCPGMHDNLDDEQLLAVVRKKIEGTSKDRRRFD